MSAGHKTIEIQSARKAVEYLNDQIWHDSILYEIVLVRSGSADRVVLKLDLSLDWKDEIYVNVELAFNECRHVRTQMNWGVKCISEGEQIFGAESSEADALIDEIRETWRKVGIQLDNLGVFRMELASTGSTIEIVFSGITVKHLGEPREVT